MKIKGLTVRTTSQIYKLLTQEVRQEIFDSDFKKCPFCGQSWRKHREKIVKFTIKDKNIYGLAQRVRAIIFKRLGFCPSCEQPIPKS